MVKYPDATGRQIIQSLVRNTDGAYGEPVYTKTWGWGPVDVGQLFAVDPSQYPDVNPLRGALGELLEEAPAGTPAAETGVATGASSGPSAGPGPVAGSGGGGVSLSPVWLLVGGGGLLVVGGVVVAVVVAAGRRRNQSERGVY
jgi:hypothetical protein